MLLLDKSYFDYDYEKVEKPILWEETIKSDEEVSGLLATFGIGQRPKTTEEIQQHIINQMEDK